MNKNLITSKAHLLTFSLLSLGFSFFSACSDNSSSATDDNTSNGLYHQAYAITVDEENQSMTLRGEVQEEICFVENSKAEWKTETTPVEIEAGYYIPDDGGSLSIESDDATFKELINPANTSIYGVWYIEGYDDTLHTCTVTQDSIICEGPINEETNSTPVETSINVRASYVLEDLYHCIAGSNCYVSDWHFTKSDESENLQLEQSLQITVHDVVDNTLWFNYNGQEFFFNIDHVQEDSNNNGNTYYSAYVISNQKTCHYSYLSKPITKDLCNMKYKDYFYGWYAEDEDDKDGDGDYGDDEDLAWIFAYIDENEDEFLSCFKSLLE